MKILNRLEGSRQFWFIIFSSFLFFLLRLPSFFEPLWYGDEGIYQVVGISLNHGKLLYSQIFDNKPPLLYWLYAIFQSDQFTIRLISAIFGIFSILVFFLLSKKLFKNNHIPYLTTAVFVLLFGLPGLEGNIANAENFMLLPIIASALLILNSQKTSPNRSSINPLSLIINHYFLAGLLLGIAFLFKIVAIFDLGAFLAFYFILNFDSLRKEFKISKILAGFFLPVVLIALFFVANGTFIDFVKAVFTANVSYVNYGNRIGSLPIFLFIKLALLGIFLLYVFAGRKKINPNSLFILIWFAFSLFNAYFSQRPYTHYLLVLIPSFSLMIGLLFDKQYRKAITIIFLITLLIIIRGFGVPKFNKIFNYYQNFISYIAGGKTTALYQAFFDRNTVSDYEIARFIKPKLTKNDTIFVWGNNAQLYQLVGVVAPTKYIVAYHISNYKDGPPTTQATVEKTKPKFIVVMENSGPIPFPLINYSRRININNAAIYERVF